jgi:hypothetical protein
VHRLADLNRWDRLSAISLTPWLSELPLRLDRMIVAAVDQGSLCTVIALPGWNSIFCGGCLVIAREYRHPLTNCKLNGQILSPWSASSLSDSAIWSQHQQIAESHRVSIDLKSASHHADTSYLARSDRPQRRRRGLSDEETINVSAPNDSSNFQRLSIIARQCFW